MSTHGELTGPSVSRMRLLPCSESPRVCRAFLARRLEDVEAMGGSPQNVSVRSGLASLWQAATGLTQRCCILGLCSGRRGCWRSTRRPGRWRRRWRPSRSRHCGRPSATCRSGALPPPSSTPRSPTSRPWHRRVSSRSTSLSGGGGLSQLMLASAVRPPGGVAPSPPGPFPPPPEKDPYGAPEAGPKPGDSLGKAPGGDPAGSRV
jgi:hypothetical protein